MTTGAVLMAVGRVLLETKVGAASGSSTEDGGTRYSTCAASSKSCGSGSGAGGGEVDGRGEGVAGDEGGSGVRIEHRGWWNSVLDLRGKLKELRLGQRDRCGHVEIGRDADIDLDWEARIGEGWHRGRQEDNSHAKERGQANGRGDGLPEAAHLLDGVGFDGDGELNGIAFVDRVGVKILEGDRHQELFERPVVLREAGEEVREVEAERLVLIQLRDISLHGRVAPEWIAAHMQKVQIHDGLAFGARDSRHET